jgi:hypothetical protein
MKCMLFSINNFNRNGLLIEPILCAIVTNYNDMLTMDKTEKDIRTSYKQLLSYQNTNIMHKECTRYPPLELC